MNRNTKKSLAVFLGLAIIVICGYFNVETSDVQNIVQNATNNLTYNSTENVSTASDTTTNTTSYDLSNIPEYSGEIYVTINNNVPEFTDEDMNLEEDYYSELTDGKVRNGNGKNQLDKSK